MLSDLHFSGNDIFTSAEASRGSSFARAVDIVVAGEESASQRA